MPNAPTRTPEPPITKHHADTYWHVMDLASRVRYLLRVSDPISDGDFAPTPRGVAEALLEIARGVDEIRG